jgi:hypothetical protein
MVKLIVTAGSEVFVAVCESKESIETVTKYDTPTDTHTHPHTHHTHITLNFVQTR